MKRNELGLPATRMLDQGIWISRLLPLPTCVMAPVVGLPSALWSQLGLSVGAKVRVTQGPAAAILPAEEAPSLAPTAVRIASGHAHTASLGAMFGTVSVEKA